MLNWEILLKWAEVVERDDVNAHAQRREEAPQEILRSCSIVGSVTHPSSPKNDPRNLSNGVTEAVEQTIDRAYQDTEDKAQP